MWWPDQVDRLQIELVGLVELGSAWAGNSVNCVPFRHAGLLRRGSQDLVSFYEPGGAVVVTLVAQSEVVERIQLPSPLMPDDAHQAISLGLDPTDRLHVAWGAHNSVLQTATSHTAQLGDGFMTAALTDEAGITYPMFISTGEGLLLMHRRGPHFRGELVVRRQAQGAPGWMADPAAIMSGISDGQPCGPYVNTPVLAGDGRLVLFIVWRLPGEATSAGAVVNAGIDCMCSSDGLRSLETFGGVKIRGTVVPAYSERVIPTRLGCSLINQASAAVMPDGRPAVLTYWDEGDGVPQYRLGWPELDVSGAATWRVACLSRFTTPYRLDGGGTLPLPHSRPELLFDAKGRALVIFRSIEHGNRLVLSIHSPPYNEPGETRVLVDEDLGQYEPVLSRDAWNSAGELVLYVQHCAQGLGRDGKPDRSEAQARLLRWRFGPRQRRVTQLIKRGLWSRLMRNDPKGHSSVGIRQRSCH